MSEWVAVCLDEHDEPVEIPTESDGSLSLASVCAQFPGASGLKYRNPETNTLRGVRMTGETMFPPTEEGWGLYTYFCVRAKDDSPKKDEPRLKRKTESDVDMYSKNIKVESDEEDEERTSDLIILGLPWKTSEDDIREYFEPFGAVLMVQLKKRPGTGESKGFAFIRFADKETEKKVLLQRHMIDGRWCDLKVPDSQDKKDGKTDKSSCKIFVGRVTENLSKEDLRDHFEAFGQVTDVYIPTPFRQFAFVQFSECKVAQSLLGKEHLIKGVSVKIGEAAPKGRDHGGNMRGGRGGGDRFGGDRFGGYDGGYSTGGGGRDGGWGGGNKGGFGGGNGGGGGSNGGGFSMNWGSGGGYGSSGGPSWGGGQGPSFGAPGPSYGGGASGGGYSSFGGNGGNNGGGFGGGNNGGYGGGNNGGGYRSSGGSNWNNGGGRQQDRRY